MAERNGPVQSTSSVPFLGMDIMGDWWAANAMALFFFFVSLAPCEGGRRRGERWWDCESSQLRVRNDLVTQS